VHLIIYKTWVAQPASEDAYLKKLVIVGMGRVSHAQQVDQQSEVLGHALQGRHEHCFELLRLAVEELRKLLAEIPLFLHPRTEDAHQTSARRH
jgi:hypothetical protein